MDVANLPGMHVCRQPAVGILGTKLMNDSIAVRYAPGVIAESQRQVHMAELPADTGIPRNWLTYCGIEIPSRLAEVSEQPAGMPCMRCLARITPA